MKRRSLGLAAALGVALSACGAGGHVVVSGPATGSSAVAAPTPPTARAATGPLGTGKVVFTANFADPRQGWPTGSSADEAESVTGSSYVVQRKVPGQVVPIPNFTGVTPADLVSVAVSTSFQINTATPGDGAGVVCRDIHSHAYVFTLGPSPSAGQLAWSISRQDTSASPQDTAVNRQLASGTVAAPGSGPLSIEGDCVGGGKNHAPATLVMSLGSQIIGQAVDSNLPVPYFGASTVQLTSTKGPAAATFNAFEIRAATGP